MAGVTIYGLSMSTCTQRILIAAAEKQVKVNLQVVDLAKGEHKAPAYLARQPFGKIPAMQDGSFSLYESRAICRYLEDKYSTGNHLVPSTVECRALLEQWASIESTMAQDLGTILLNRMWGPMQGKKTNEEAVAQAAASVSPAFDVLEQHLAKQGGECFIVGKQFTLVDIFLAPYFNLLLNTPEKQLIESRPAVTAYWKRVQARPSWQVVSKQ